MDYRAAVIAALTDELRGEEWTARANGTLAGFCYVASEALHHLEPGRYKPAMLTHDGVRHWYLVEVATGEVVDLTADQFDTPPDYTTGRGRGFMTGSKPSKRAQIVLDRVRGQL